MWCPARHDGGIDASAASAAAADAVASPAAGDGVMGLIWRRLSAITRPGASWPAGAVIARLPRQRVMPGPALCTLGCCVSWCTAHPPRGCVSARSPPPPPPPPPLPAAVPPRRRRHGSRHDAILARSPPAEPRQIADPPVVASGPIVEAAHVLTSLVPRVVNESDQFQALKYRTPSGAEFVCKLNLVVYTVF